MNVSLITPAAKRARNGNRVTAVRWARLLGELGHRVGVEQSWRPGQGAQPDLMIAIHAYRSVGSVAAFRDRYPDRGLVVLLAGTDIYRFQHSDPAPTLTSMDLADRLVGLHDRVDRDIPERFGPRLRIIHQSALPLASPRQPSRRRFDVCVIGHLREEKDPLRAAFAARELPADSRVRVVHLGMAHDEDWAERARAEMRINPRYLWRGDQPPHRVRQAMSRAHAMVISSRMEGGANVVSEAVVAGLPVIASRISGNLGLLGPQHPGYYPVEDTGALARALRRAETEAAFINALLAGVRCRRPLFTPERERAAWASLLAEF